MNGVAAGCGNVTVLALGVTVKARVTGTAGATVVEPTCAAVIEHEPPDTNVRTPGVVTVHTVWEFDA